MEIIDITEPGVESEKEEEIVVGIDFGTTNSLIAYSKNHCPQVIGALVPSVIFYDEVHDNFVIGKHQGIRGSLSSVKRLLAKSAKEIREKDVLRKAIEVSGFVLTESATGIPKLRVHGYDYSFPELAAKIFAYLKEQAEEQLQVVIRKAVVSVPAYFDDAARGAIMLAAKIAGFEVLRLVAEPTAAAYAYGLDKNVSGTYMVYDLGGGTFDVSILAMRQGVLQVIATGGDNLLGGDDIDHILAEYLAKKFDTDLDHDHYLQAKKIKESLSLMTENTDIDKLENLISPLIARTIKIAKTTLFDADVKLDGIILVGGSTKMPMIGRRLSESFGVKVFSDLDPDKAVVLGVALQGENLSYRTSSIQDFYKRKSKRTLLIDVLPLSLGLELYGGLTEKIILRNTPIPFSVTKSFTTYADNQTGMQFHIVQGEREMAVDCRSLARFELRNIPPMRAGMARIEVIFAIDADGILSVTAREETSGVLQNIELKASFGLSQAEIDDILEKAYRNSALDHEVRLLASTRIDAEKLLAGIAKAMQETPDLLGKEEKKSIKEAISSLQKCINSDNREEIFQKMQELNKLAKNFIEKHLNIGAELMITGRRIDDIE